MEWTVYSCPEHGAVTAVEYDSKTDTHKCGVKWRTGMNGYCGQTLEAHIVTVDEGNYPKGAPKPEPNDVVAVLMTEEMARRFEERCLGHNTKGHTELAGPLLFQEDDTPTYIIGVSERP